MKGPGKGNTNNPAGRPKGKPNKVTKELRERISDFLSGNWEQVEKDFQSLEPEKKIMIYEKLLQFTLPRLQSVQTPDIKISKIPSIVFKNFQEENELNNKLSDGKMEKPGSSKRNFKTAKRRRNERIAK
jgi:hypothetical protein